MYTIKKLFLNKKVKKKGKPEVFLLKCSVSAPRLKEISKHEVQRNMGILNQIS